MKRVALTFLLVILIFGCCQPIFQFDQATTFVDTTSPVKTMISNPSASSGISVGNNPYIILEYENGSVPARGINWLNLLESRGIYSTLLSTTDLIDNPDIISNSPAIVIDGSLGSNNGDQVESQVLDILICVDTPLILTGSAIWLLHRLTERTIPSQTAPVATILTTNPEYAGAVFLTQPNALTTGSLLSTESTLLLPIFDTQTSMSRLVNLSGSSDSTIAPFRYDSYPLDMFLFAFENPNQLTSTGIDLFENIIAYSGVLRESTTAEVIASTQSFDGSLLAGGFNYMHSPSISSTYYAIHLAQSLMTESEWSAWVAEKTPTVINILNGLIIDYGSEAGFMTSKTEGTVNCQSSAQGLFVIAAIGLTAEFPVDKIVNYLSSRQATDGSFENYITTTFHVAEALDLSGYLGSIDTEQLESWLQSLVIDGTKTTDPNLWGAIGPNPTSISAKTNYATEYLLSLGFIGKAHPDPSKMTSWILTRTSNGDGSFRNSIGVDEELVTGTASAITCMQILGTLNLSNKTASLNWLSSNQLISGGFGMKSAMSDLVAKSRETWRVAISLEVLDETTSLVADLIIDYLSSISTDIGFESMDLLPSLMWTNYLVEASRFVHASPLVNLEIAEVYLKGFESMTVYPYWENLTTTSSPEYLTSQYRTKSVWTQYFGVSSASVLGIQLDPSVVSDIVLYISQSQYLTGHYRPTSFTGTAHMQYSVAAIETLYLLGELDTIAYRSSLENAILSEYNSGSWDLTGWTLEPFADSQEMVDFLSTRAALRLGLLTPTMAFEIISTIEARIQYSDLLALSMDVATLALLQSSAFSASVDIIDSSIVLSALRSSYFTDGWFNSTKQWQPLFTDSVLRMVSILGLRPKLNEVSGSILNASSDSTAQLDSVLEISVEITSSIGLHTVLVSAFGETTLFQNVADTDILHLNIPSRSDLLGLCAISLTIVDWGFSRDFDSLSVTIEGSLEGSLDLETPVVKMGELVNATISWALAGGGDPGLSQVTVRLGDAPIYHQWTYEVTSPFWLSIPSADFAAGIYNLTVTITVSNCPSLILQNQIQIAEPNPTYIQSTEEQDGFVGEVLSIDWSLRFQENETVIPGQTVFLSIRDSSGTVVYVDQMISSIIPVSFDWTPTSRGDFVFSLTFHGNNTLDESQTQGVLHIFEGSILSWHNIGLHDQYSYESITIQLTTLSGEQLIDKDIHVIVTSPSAITILDATLTTNGTGHISFFVTLSENGLYLLQANFEANEFLLGCSESDSITSWSSSSLEIGGIQTEELLGKSKILWARLTDIAGFPVQGQQVTIRVVFLPSTAVKEQTLITNSSGFISIQWTPSSTGYYRFEAGFNGSLSRSSVSTIIDFEVLIPVFLSISYSPSPEVGVVGLVQISASDHQSSPISSLQVTITIESPTGEVIYTNVSMTSNGIVVFPWTPSIRGSNIIFASSEKQSWYQDSNSSSAVGVSETPLLQILIPDGLIVPISDTVAILILDHLSTPIEGVTIHSYITLNGIVLYDSEDTTNSMGHVDLFLLFSEPGTLDVQVEVSTQDWFLETSQFESSIILASTWLTITIPGMPIEQGSTLGFLVALHDYSDSLLSGADIEIILTWSNGTLLASFEKTTDSNGQCTFARTFNNVGDFVISAYYDGFQFNASASDAVTQRVFTTPNIQLTHDPSCIVGESIVFQMALIDSLSNYIIGRTIYLSIEQDGLIVFEAQTQSVDGISTITWYPQAGGLAAITILHDGNSYFLTNSTISSLSVLELVSGSLEISPSQIDLFDSTVLVYILSAGSPRAGISIHFEVLGMDLVPIWSMNTMTNSSGIASVTYTAIETHGVLHVNAGPLSEEFLIGGDVQEQLIVMTSCSVSVTMQPYPPSVNSVINISIEIQDELGKAVDGISVTVSAYDPYGQQIKLGSWTNSITAVVEDGKAVVQFTPTMVGLYSVTITSSGAISVHGFSISTHHTIYSVTQIQLYLSTKDLEVGQMLEVSARLVDHNGNPMIGRNITFNLNGPGSSSIGPVLFITNSTGFVTWDVDIDDEGLWSLSAVFNGLGVYLPASAFESIDVKYGTVVILSLLTADDIVAGVNNASFSVLLEDTSESPLEGFTVHYEVYHETLGLLTQGNLIQSDTEPMILTLSLNRMGSITLIVSFGGTSHYHASNAALEFWVFGTTTVVSDIPEEIDRANTTSMIVTIKDEVYSTIPLTELELTFELQGPEGLVDLSNRILWNNSFVEFYATSLAVGHYTFSVLVVSSSERIGCLETFEFDITSFITIEVDENNLSGLISTPHSLTFFLRDSMTELVADEDVWVSLYDPRGREIYGHPLTTKTLLSSSILGTEVSWTPALTGEYHLFIYFEGGEFYNQSTLEVVILVRYESTLEIDAAELVKFGEVLPVTITLNGAIGGLSGQPILITVSMNGLVEKEISIVTGSRGIISHNLVGFLAGVHTINVTFIGSDSQAPCSTNVMVKISPVVVVVIDDDATLFVARNCSVCLSLNVLGTSSIWNGSLKAILLTPDNQNVGIWNFEITPHSVLYIDFMPLREGTYSLNITVFGLPVIIQQTYPLTIAVVRESLQISLDVGSTPLIGGFGILSVVGIFMRKKMKSVVDSLPGEWSE